MELAGGTEKFAKRLHPRDEETTERHAVDAFLGALEWPLAAEVQKLGYRTMEEVVAAAKRIGKSLEEQTDSNLEHLVDIMQGQIRTLKRVLKEANEAIATHTAAAMAIIHAPASTVIAATQAPPTAPTCHVNHNYGDKVNRPRLPLR